MEAAKTIQPVAESAKPVALSEEVTAVVTALDDFPEDWVTQSSWQELYNTKTGITLRFGWSTLDGPLVCHHPGISSDEAVALGKACLRRAAVKSVEDQVTKASELVAFKQHYSGD